MYKHTTGGSSKFAQNLRSANVVQSPTFCSSFTSSFGGYQRLSVPPLQSLASCCFLAADCAFMRCTRPSASGEVAGEGGGSLPRSMLRSVGGGGEGVTTPIQRDSFLCARTSDLV